MAATKSLKAGFIMVMDGADQKRLPRRADTICVMHAIMPPMNLLAIETATESCSVALLHGETVIERQRMVPRCHAQWVLPMADALLTEAGLGRHALDGFAVGRGPGTFTGVRLAVSLVQGMALALDRPVASISSLAALALQAPDDGAAILAVTDARMGEIYAASYSVGPNGELVPLDAEWVGSSHALVLTNRPAWHVIGSGWLSDAGTLRKRLSGTLRSAAGERYPRARHVMELAVREFRAGRTHAAQDIRPVYLRNKVALTLSEQKKG